MVLPKNAADKLDGEKDKQEQRDLEYRIEFIVNNVHMTNSKSIWLLLTIIIIMDSTPTGVYVHY